MAINIPHMFSRSMNTNSLIGDALQEMERRSAVGKATWSRAVQNIIDCLGLNTDTICKDISASDYMKTKTGRQINTLLENRYSEYWERQINRQNGKLDTYICLKSKFEYESYLDAVKLNSHQVALTRLRISNRRLHIETGRYKRRWV